MTNPINLHTHTNQNTEWILEGDKENKKSYHDLELEEKNRRTQEQHEKPFNKITHDIEWIVEGEEVDSLGGTKNNKTGEDEKVPGEVNENKKGLGNKSRFDRL